jgi:hypothetical protein
MGKRRPGVYSMQLGHQSGSSDRRGAIADDKMTVRHNSDMLFQEIA